jgi:peroxiredoxin (alkyl hydroperoxide reductase subunit C)
VIGISADAPDRNLAWTRELGLPFRLLSDGDGAVGKRFGVWDDLWRIERRTTFIVDAGGVVRYVEVGTAAIDTNRALDALRTLATAK